MADANQCPQCGAALAPDAVRGRGLCPACLLKRGMETDTVDGSAESSATPRWTPPPADELAGSFPELEGLELIGRGGMGAVYKARQKSLDRIVALKVLPPEIGRDPAFAQRFAREAQAMARLNHPSIVAIHEFGQRGELFFFMMEFVDGLSLRQLLDAGGVSPKEALAIVPQICDALQYAHDQGIVHRDIKPENILLNKAGRVKIADFGLAKLVRRALPGVAGTQGAGEGRGIADRGLRIADREEAATAGVPGVPGVTWRVMGTPQYMAPEQGERPSEVDHRADIYSLGVVFYQMLTGELPVGRFEAPSHKVQIDVRLDEVVLKALEREPSRRYQQASEVKTQVETIVQTAGARGASPPFRWQRLVAVVGLRDGRRVVNWPAVIFDFIAMAICWVIGASFAHAGGAAQIGGSSTTIWLTFGAVFAISVVVLGIYLGFTRTPVERLIPLDSDGAARRTIPLIRLYLVLWGSALLLLSLPPTRWVTPGPMLAALLGIGAVALAAQPSRWQDGVDKYVPPVWVGRFFRLIALAVWCVMPVLIFYFPKFEKIWLDAGATSAPLMSFAVSVGRWLGGTLWPRQWMPGLLWISGPLAILTTLARFWAVGGRKSARARHNFRGDGSTEYPPSGHGVADGRPSTRLSRVAVAGAVWVPWGFAFFLAYFTHHAVSTLATGAPAGPAWWQTLLLIVMAALGLTSPLGTTICGAVSVMQVRRSQGRLYGLPLALFDVLFYPLLALDGMIFWIWYRILWWAMVERVQGANGDNVNVLFVVLPALLMSILADSLIGAWAWGAARRPADGSPSRVVVPPGRAGPPSRSNRGAKRSALFGCLAVVGWVAAAAILLAWAVSTTGHRPVQLSPEVFIDHARQGHFSDNSIVVEAERMTADLKPGFGSAVVQPVVVVISRETRELYVAELVKAGVPFRETNDPGAFVTYVLPNLWLCPLAGAMMIGLVGVVLTWVMVRRRVGPGAIPPVPHENETGTAAEDRVRAAFGWVACGLLLAGLLVPFVLAALTNGDAPIAFGVVAEAMALVLGLIAWRRVTGKIAVIGSSVLLVLAVGLLLSSWGPRPPKPALYDHLGGAVRVAIMGGALDASSDRAWFDPAS